MKLKHMILPFVLGWLFAIVLSPRDTFGFLKPRSA
jgi:hypothetical protein